MDVEVEKKHSEYGIASLAITIIVIILWIAGLNIASLTNYFSGYLFVFLFLGVPVAALILGIVGLIQKKRKKIFPILGIVFSILELFAVGSLFVLIMLYSQ
ncbi:MAG: hypothetical protein FIA98_16625 [Anaerolineae bacterium]|nr:hypothetical protein [Anaerolineae bacterium]